MISYGQSWRTNYFPSFATFSFNTQPQELLALRTTSVGSPTFAPGPLPNSAGISIPGTINGVTFYAPSDVFAIGRMSVLAKQLFRARAGVPLVPRLEFCAGFPGSTWTSGGGGGLGPGATFNGSITNDTLTVTSVASGVIVINQAINNTTAGTVIISGSGSSWVVGVGQSVASEAMTASGAGAITASISNGAAGVGNQLNVTATSGGLTTDTITGAGVLANTKITSQISGAAGGIGIYALEVGSPQTVGATTFNSTGTSWTNHTTILNKVPQVFPTQFYQSPLFKGVGYTQGAGGDNTRAGKIADLTAMLTLYDAKNLPGAGLTGMNYYLGLPAAQSDQTTFSTSYYGTVDFARTNAPGMGGTWSGRVFYTSSSYQWPFNGGDNIHTGDYGTARWGEWEGYVSFLAEDKGVLFTPLWRPLTGGAITISGTTVTVPFSRPSGPDFTTAPMVWQSQPNDGIKVWPQYGFHVFCNGVEDAAVPVISGTNVLLSLATPCASGNSLEVSYAWYGPGGPNPGSSSGVGGNLTINGPPSVLFAGVTLDAWAVPFDETITVP